MESIEDGRKLFRETDKKYRRKKKLSKHIAHMSAYLAKAAYEHRGGHQNHGGWRHKPHWSTDRIVVHQHHMGNLHIALRGSDFLSPSRGFFDLANDTMIAMGIEKFSPEFQKVKKEVNDIIDYHKYKYGLQSEVTLSGHSLGGSMVAHIMEDPNIKHKVHEAHVFNPGHGISFMHRSHPKHLHIHHNKHDLVNHFARTNTGATWHYHDSGAMPGDIIGAHWNNNWNTSNYWMSENISSESIEDDNE